MNFLPSCAPLTRHIQITTGTSLLALLSRARHYWGTVVEDIGPTASSHLIDEFGGGDDFLLGRGTTVILCVLCAVRTINMEASSLVGKLHIC